MCREREGGGGHDKWERGRLSGAKREEGERERIYAAGWLTELVEPSGMLALSVTVIVFALQPGYGEACFRV